MTANDPFLDDDYEVPEPPAKFLKWSVGKKQEGDNLIRVLSPRPLMGYVGWRTEKNGSEKKRMPVRKRMGEGWSDGEVDDLPAKHFWALAVWNYGLEAVQVVEITQRGIQKAIKDLSKDADWGSPTKYDLLIHAEGDGLNREYTVKPKPARALAAHVAEKWAEVQAAGFDLSRLYANGDPFGEDAATATATTDGDPGTEDRDLGF